MRRVVPLGSRPPDKVDVDGRLAAASACAPLDAPSTGDDTLFDPPPNPLPPPLSPSNRAASSFICPGRMLPCFCSRRSMSPPADGAAATSAQIAASRTAGSRSSSV